jgi:hypothetical protein
MDTTNLKVCDILLYKGIDWISRLIQWKTKSPYSHVSVVVSPETSLAIESNTGSQSGVRALDLRKLNEKEVDVFRIKSQFNFSTDKIISDLVGHLGAGYDYAGVAWLAILKVCNAHDRSNQFQKNNDYFCSELCYEAFNAGGLDIVPQVAEADITSPGDISQSERIEKITLK